MACAPRVRVVGINVLELSLAVKRLQLNDVSEMKTLVQKRGVETEEVFVHDGAVKKPSGKFLRLLVGRVEVVLKKERT